MQHLTTESLARLVDEPGLPEEARHVRDCLVCRRELEELKEQTEALADLSALGLLELDDDDGALDPPAGAWEALEARLRDEGLVRDAAPAPHVLLFRRPALRAAAAVAVFLLGGAAGVAVFGGGPARDAEQGIATLPPETAEGIESAGSFVPAGGMSPDEATVVVIDEMPAPVASVPGARLASEGAPAPARREAPRRAASPVVTRAQRELAEAEAQYQAALQRYAGLADEAGADPVSRLAALDRLVEVTRAALERAPADPVINGYHVAALRERDEVRRRIAQASEENWF
jgi:hypothetical protein